MIVRHDLQLHAPSAETAQLDVPLVVPLTGGTATVEVGETDGVYRLVIDQRVRLDALSLRLNTGVRHVDTPDVEIPMVEVDPAGIEGAERAVDIAAALTFLTDRPFDVSWGHRGSELVPETDDDEHLLRSFGTQRVWHQLEGRLSVRTFHERITPALLAALVQKHVGLQLYSDAVRVRSERVRYRELWLVLESAFGLKGPRLTEALASYPPAAQLGFTEDELEDLRQFRGRASHAESRDGIGELRRVSTGVADREGRLKTLVERVVLTKKIWGSRSLEVEELATLTSWVAKDAAFRHGPP